MENTKALKPQAINTFVIHRQDKLGEVCIELMQDYPYTFRNPETEKLETTGVLEQAFLAVMSFDTAEKLRDALNAVLNPENNQDLGNMAENNQVH